MDLTPKQIRATELIGQGLLTFKVIARIVGVSEQTINTWKQDKEFCEECLRVARQLYRTHAPAVYNKLVLMAKAGNMNAIRTYIEHMEVIDKLVNQINSSSITFSWEQNDHKVLPTPISGTISQG